MQKEQSIELLKSFSNANGVSGFEDEVLDVIRGLVKDIGTVERDSVNNLYVARRKNRGGRPVIQLDAHTDEVGFMVQSIMDNGLIKFVTLGGWVNANIPAHLVRIRNRKGNYVRGVVATKPPHYMSEAEKNSVPSVDSMTIDIGASSRNEVLEDYGIGIGAPVVPEVEFWYDEAHDNMFGKAFDCRAGCAALTETLLSIEGEDLQADVIAAYSAQEEVGLRGAMVSSNRVRPDCAIVFEGCPADDTFSPSFAIQTGLRRGPMLRHFDAKMITNPRFQRFALDLASSLGIEVQEAVRTGGATNGGAIHLSHFGVPTIVIGLPVRYIHSHYGIACYSDYKGMVELGCALLKNLNEEIIRSF
ncbi:MAG: M42 family peptidase [Clostridia bacterium]|nr:M42 family peptidase [Clostridia bacterium]